MFSISRGLFVKKAFTTFVHIAHRYTIIGHHPHEGTMVKFYLVSHEKHLHSAVAVQHPVTSGVGSHISPL